MTEKKSESTIWLGWDNVSLGHKELKDASLDIIKWRGVLLTPRNISDDLANLPVIVLRLPETLTTPGNLKQSLEETKIVLPVDLQAILPKATQLYDEDLTVAQSISLETAGYKLVGIECEATAETTFKVEYSYNEVKWFEHYTSPVAEVRYHDLFQTTAHFVRLSSELAGAAGDMVTLIIGACL